MLPQIQVSTWREKPRLCVLAVLPSVWLAASLEAAPVTVPTGLSPGDQYRLVFVTTATIDAAATDISTYNAFVDGVANAVPELAALGTTWAAIASTENTDARDNTGTSLPSSPWPLYKLDDTLFLPQFANLWNSNPASTLDIDETGQSTSLNFAWTGTNVSGTAYPQSWMGSVFGDIGTPTSYAGYTIYQDSRWIEGTAAIQPLELPMFAISGVLTVQPVPEPSTLALASLALATFALVAIRRESK